MTPHRWAATCMTKCSICSGSLSSSGRDLMWPRRVGGLPRVGDYPARPTGAIDVSNPGQACDLLDSGRGTRRLAVGDALSLVPWARGAATELCVCWTFGVAVCGRGEPFAASWSCMADRCIRLFLFLLTSMQDVGASRKVVTWTLCATILPS